MSQMHHGRKMRRAVVCAACACATGIANAGFSADADPGGFETIKTKLGTDWSVASSFTAWSFDPGAGVAVASGELSSITYRESLPDKPLSMGGGADAWRLGVTAREMSGLELPGTYTDFRLGVFIDGVSVGELAVPVSSVEEQTAFIDIGVVSGEVELRLRWLNPGTRFFQNRPELGIGVIQFAASEIPSPGGAALAGLSVIAATGRRRIRPKLIFLSEPS
jgi:hypothetical protein